MRATLKLLPALAIMAVILILPNTAGAVVLTGGASGSPGTPTCAGCAGALGPVTWFDVHNTGGPDTNDIPYNASQIDNIRDQLGQGQSNTGQLFNEAGQLFLSACAGAFVQDQFDANAWLEPNSTKCPVWWNTKTTAPAGQVQWNQIHSYWPDKTLDPTLGTLAAFNIKIWRENRRTHTLQLIFARQLGVNGVNSENDSAWGQNADQYWWYGGNTDNPNGNGGLGGRFTNTGETSAGPLGSYEGNDHQQCVNNWAAGQNGTLGIDGKAGHVVQNVRPTSADQLNNNFCYWEGSQLGPNAFSWSQDEPDDLIAARDAKFGNSNSEIKNQEFGPASPNDNYGVTGAGLHEAIYIDWNVPQGDGSKPYIDWKIEGAPGLFYAVQVSAVDGREQLLPLPPSQNQKNNGYLYVKRQIFSATLVDPILSPVNPPCSADRKEIQKDHGAWTEDQIEAQLEKDGYSAKDDPGCFPSPDTGCTTSCCTGNCTTPTPADFAGSPPDVDVQLDSDSPAQTREHTNQNIDINVNNYSDTQAVFPYLENLIHYTPQQRFSSPGAAAASTDGQFTDYDNNYIYYDDYPDGTQVPKQPADVAAAPSGDQAPFNAQEAVLTRGLELQRDPSTGSFSNGAGPLSTQSYGMTWLQPTLLNPCGTANASPLDVHNNNYGWPSDPQVCGTDASGYPNTIDAWDDMLQAKAWWEERWENGVQSTASSPDLIGTIYDENLRCADQVTNPDNDPNGGERVEDCQHPSYGIFATVANSTSQNAQGYLDVTGQAGAPGYAYISLRTNRPDRVSSATVTDRDAGTGPQPNYMQGAGPYGLENTVTGYVEQSYCYQGLPGPDTADYSGVGAKVKLQLTNGTIQTLDDASGDPGCRGYDARWYWPQPGDSDYDTSCNAAPNKQPPVMPTGQSWPGVPVNPEGYSGYSGYYRDADSRLGTATDYDPDSFIGSPYVGKRPGQSTIDGTQYENYQLCQKPVPARYTDGYWSRAFAFRAVGQSSDSCQYHYSDLYNDAGNLRAKFDAPNSYSESNYGNGYGQQCDSTFGTGTDAPHRWRFGFYYPVNAEWHWDPNSAELGVPNNDTGKSMTPIGPGQPQRDLGKYWDRAPNATEIANNGWDGYDTIEITTGNHNHADEDIDQYFADSVWVKMVEKQGYLTSGHWVLNQGPQEGWGLNNSGFRLDASGYVADYTFSWPDAGTAASELAYAPASSAGSSKFPIPGQACPVFAFNNTTPGTCWSMQATYEGYSNRQWRFAQGTNDEWQDSAYVTIYGPRDSR